MASIRDPEGCTELRLHLQDLERDVKGLEKEREGQYKQMRLMLRLLEDTDERTQKRIKEQNSQYNANQEAIFSMKQKQDNLKRQSVDFEIKLNHLLDKPVWVKKMKKKVTQPDGQQTEVEVEVEDLTYVTYDQLVAKANLTEKEMEKFRGLIAAEERSKINH